MHGAVGLVVLRCIALLRRFLLFCSILFLFFWLCGFCGAWSVIVCLGRSSKGKTRKWKGGIQLCCSFYLFCLLFVGRGWWVVKDIHTVDCLYGIGAGGRSV